MSVVVDERFPGDDHGPRIWGVRSGPFIVAYLVEPMMPPTMPKLSTPSKLVMKKFLLRIDGSTPFILKPHEHEDVLGPHECFGNVPAPRPTVELGVLSPFSSQEWVAVLCIGDVLQWESAILRMSELLASRSLTPKP